MGRNDQVLVLVNLIIGFKKIEYLAHILQNTLVGSEKGIICIDFSSGFVEIPGTDKTVALHRMTLFALYHTYFAVHLQSGHSKYEVDPFGLQIVGVLNVVLLVKPCLQFNLN